MKFLNDFVSLLQTVGYDYVLSIEHEDPLMSSEEGLSKAVNFLKQVTIFKNHGDMWWA